jgi:hypothetical protein
MQILIEYYDKLIVGIKYEILENKEKFFTPFVEVDKIRHFLFNHEKTLIKNDGFGETEFFSYKLRKKTMVCLENSVFMTINRSSLEQINKQIISE